MFISLIGLPSAGKHSVLDWLVQNHGFTPLYLRENKAANGANGGEHASKLVRRMSLNESIEVSSGLIRGRKTTAVRRLEPASGPSTQTCHYCPCKCSPARTSWAYCSHLLSLPGPRIRRIQACRSNLLSPLAALAELANAQHTFSTADDMLDYVTRAWRGRWVTLDLRTWDRAEPFLKRPFFMVVHVEAPLGARYARESRRQPG